MWLLFACAPSDDAGQDADTGAADSAADTSDTDTGDSDSEDSDSGDVDSEDTDPVVVPAWSRVADDGAQGGVDAAVAPDGTIYVSWADGAETGLWVRRSRDGGATWEDAVELDLGRATPGVAMARRPYVAADDTRVALVFTDLEAGGVYVYTSPVDALAFTRAAVLTGSAAATFDDFPKPVFRDGDLSVVWQSYSPSGWLAIAREADAWAVEDIDDAAPGLPCECCPLDVLATSAGDVLVAYRNNDDDLREHWVLTLPGGGSPTGGVQASDTEGRIDACPMQGPRLAETDDAVLMAWTDATGANVAWIARSEDGGATWSDETAVSSRTGLGSPTLAASATGTVWVSAETGLGTVLSTSDDGGATFGDPLTLQTSDGDLGFGQLASGGGVTVVAGTSGGGVWVYRGE